MFLATSVNDVNRFSLKAFPVNQILFPLGEKAGTSIMGDEMKGEVVSCGGHAVTEEVRIPPPTPPNFLGRIRERNLTFCIDTSGSMYKSLDVIKQHLCEFLNNLAGHPLPTTFNLIEFSSEVTQWANELVSTTPGTVSIAQEWINSLEAKTGTNTLEALTAAFASNICDAVVLITDGLPDQNPADILDKISVVSNQRPVHCYYIRNGFDSDELAVPFLEDLAMETYGSFHIISLTQHGAIEKVTPVYRADMAGERMIRTTHGRIYPSTLKECSVAATLDAPVDYVVERVGPEYVIEESVGTVPNYLYYPSSDPRHFYSYYYPYHGWSRYHPARSWMKSADKIIDIATMDKLPPHVSPGAGSLLIGTKVIARRHEDGYFYIGTVKSQIFEQKFLVEFGPCRHGKFRETSYQETYVYDIVSYDDALRHSVLVGDKVLAPYEPDGERFGPATVIEGQEKRQSDISSCGDTTIAVSFDHDGKSATMKGNVVVWVPTALHERIAFELKLPAKVRKEIAMTEEYPLDSLPGYPRSGFVPYPAEYDRFEEIVVERSPDVHEKGLYRAPYFVPLYPVKVPEKSKKKKEEELEVIPGTGLTKDELNEKVVKQLLEHKMLLEEIKRDQGILRGKLETEGGKLLSKRDTVGENSLKKSVTFEEEAVAETETKDSGNGSVTDLLSDIDLSDYDFEDEDSGSRSVAVGSDQPIFSRRRRKLRRAQKLPPWKYWKTEPAPSLLESNNFGPYRYGPFRECMMAAPLEAKTDKYGNNGEPTDEVPTDTLIHITFDRGQHPKGLVPSITELTPGVLKRIEYDRKMGKGATLDDWRETMYQVVNAGGNIKNAATVCDSMGYFPRPPPPKAEKQGPGVDISIQIGENKEEYQQQVAGRQARRQRIIERERTWEEKRTQQETMGEVMRDQHRARVLQQIKQDWQRAKDEQENIRITRENKKAISSEIRARMEENQEREHARGQQRIEALRARRDRQVRIKEDNERETAETAARRQATRGQNQLRYWASVNSDRLEQESQQKAQDDAKRAAHMQRIQHYRNLEAQGQANKLRQNQVIEQRNAMMRSSIFS